MINDSIAPAALVIDDSRPMRSLVARQLVFFGYRVEEAADGAEGLERLGPPGTFDIAFVDWNMPVLDGLGFVRAVRADPAHDGLRIAMVTTEIESSRIDEALAAGADEYVMKPFTREVIERALDTLGGRAA